MSIKLKLTQYVYMWSRASAMFYRRSYELLRGQATPVDRCRIYIVMLIVVAVVFDSVWLTLHLIRSAENLALIRDAETLTIRTPTQGFVITMHNETGHKVAEQLKMAFGIQNMQVVMGHVGNYSTLTLYNRHLMRHGRTDGLQIGNTRMLGCIESHREVWTRVQQDSYIFEDDAVPAKDALSITKMLLNDSAHRHWSVIHLDIPGGFLSGQLFAPDRTQFTNIGRITETCRDCIAYSTRGYIVTKEAAQIMIQNYEPPIVQVDAYISLLHAYHPHFKQVWSRVQAVDEHPHVSESQDLNESLQVWQAISNFLMPQH
jgi:GR25 family glycosyltransferase involved in LPS biosynthesis